MITVFSPHIATNAMTNGDGLLCILFGVLLGIDGKHRGVAHINTVISNNGETATLEVFSMKIDVHLVGRFQK